MTARRALAVLLLAAAAGCARRAEPALAPLSDAPQAVVVRRRDLPERVPAYGIAARGASGEVFEATVEAADAPKVRPGQQAFAFVLPSTSPVRCLVVRTMRDASAETGQALVWLSPEGRDGVPDNDFLYVRITVGERRGVLTAPRAAVMVRGGRTMVVRARPAAGGAVSYEPTPVVLGEGIGSDVEIRAGLSDGDAVVAVGGIGLLDPGFKAAGGD